MIKRHIPNTNEPHDLRVAFGRLWDAIEQSSGQGTTTQQQRQAASFGSLSGTGVDQSGTLGAHNTLNFIQGGQVNEYYHMTNAEYVGYGTGVFVRKTAAIYNDMTPVTAAVGGIEAGETFTDASMYDMWHALLHPYQYPSFYDFSITGQPTTLEVGDTTAADPSFTWSVSNSGNLAIDSIQIEDTTSSEVLVAGHPNTPPAAITHAGISKTSATSETYTITAQNTKAQPLSRTFSISWRWRVYHGESATTPLSEGDIKGLRVSGLKSGFAGVYAYAASPGQYKYLCYPASMGTATFFKDQGTNLDVPFEPVYTVSVTNAFGVTTDYNVHRTTNQIGSALNVVVS